MQTGKLLLLPGALLLFALLPVSAQEVDCTIQVNYDAVPTTNRDLLTNFASDLQSYVSHYNWGGGESADKVKCTINVFVQNVLGDNRYGAQVFIGSMRPRFKSDQNSAVVRLFDEMWDFTYLKDRPLNHNPYTFSDLTSFLDFYMYLIMGFDYDSYDKLGGNPMFQKAADIGRVGRSSGTKSWQPSNTSYSRTQLIDELLSHQFEAFRIASWQYHFNGVDSLAIAPERAYANILDALESIAKVRRSVDPRNLVIKTWFDAKYMELAKIFEKYPDPGVYTRLSRIDPGNQKTYDEYRTRQNK
jgi:hypothetical protein